MNWNDRIKSAKKNGRFTKEDIRLSQLWITDPISEHKDKIQLRNNDIAQGPIDIYLVLDGIFFTVGVEKNNEEGLKLAENCYLSINKRVERLLTKP